jgi:hypothetical protein
MRAPDGGRKRAGSFWKMDGGTAIFTEAALPLQPSNVLTPLRSRGLERTAGHVTTAERLVFRASDPQTEATT